LGRRREQLIKLKYKIYATEKFIRAKDSLSVDEKKQVIKTVAMLQENPRTRA